MAGDRVWAWATDASGVVVARSSCPCTTGDGRSVAGFASRRVAAGVDRRLGVSRDRARVFVRTTEPGCLVRAGLRAEFGRVQL